MKLTRRQLRKLILEYSETEKTYFGSGITALIENPDKIYIYKEDEFGNHNQFLNDELLKKVGKRKGGGFYRDTYFIDANEDLLLKISNRNDDRSKKAGIEYSTAAEEMNQNEIDFFNQYPEFFPKIYIHERAPDGNIRPSMPRWFVVEKVEVLNDYEEMNEQIIKVFPSVAVAYNYLNLWLDLKNTLLYKGISSSVLEADKEKIRLIEDKEFWIQVLFFTGIMHSFKSGTLFERLMGLNVWRAKNMTFDETVTHVNEIMNEIEGIFSSDSNMLKFNRLLKELNNVEGFVFEFNEIAPGNVGKALDGTGFRLIDISLFNQ